MPVPEDAPARAAQLSPLTAKPVLFVANVDEGDDEVAAPAVADHAAAAGRARRSRSRRGIEAELAELDDEEAASMREELGVGESGLRPGRARARSRCST